jgi:DNA-directed RNA polymerase specialized sigma24 family protein
MNAAEDSVVRWLGQLRSREPAAARELWEQYFGPMVELARSKLRGVPARAADEEDVALSAFKSFCRAVEGGRYPDLFDRDGLWALLVTITVRKAVDLKRHEHRRKRRAPAEAGAADQPEPDDVAGREPDPEIGARIAEECQRLLGLLTDPTLRTIALRKMEGFTNAEIAADLGVVGRTVERKLNLIRRLWEAGADS